MGKLHNGFCRILSGRANKQDLPFLKTCDPLWIQAQASVGVS